MSFQQLLEERDEPEWFSKVRQQEKQNSKNAKDPNFKHGLNIQVKPKMDFNKLQTAPVANMLRTIDHDKQVIVKSNAEIFEQDNIQDFTTNKWHQQSDKLTHLMQAYANDILYIEIPEDYNQKHIHIQTTIKNTTYSQIWIRAKQNSTATIHLAKDGSANFHTEDLKIIAHHNANLTILNSQNLDKDTVYIQSKKAHLHQDAQVHWTELGLGASYMKSETISQLQQPGSKTTAKVVYLTSDNQQYDIYTEAQHLAQHTHADLITKGAIKDKARALNRGLIKIEKDAANSQGYEKQDALILDKTAQADAIPNLEIHNHDVKCSHGSTIGKIDEQMLFYAMSRGMTKQQAQYMIVKGFFTPIIDMIDNKTVQDNINKNIEESLT